jgi:hypothetical protein
MIPNHEESEKVWEQTLPCIRLARKRRGRVKFAVAASSVCGLIAIGIMLQSDPATIAPQIVVTQPPLPEPTLAVMRVGEDGETRLEELAPSELGSIELAFGLTPMISDGFQDL